MLAGRQNPNEQKDQLVPRFRYFIPMVSALLAGCSIFTGDKKAYDGPTIPESQIVTIDNSGSVFYGDWTGALRRVAGDRGAVEKVCRI